jgi:hypothetical protein
MCHRRQKHYRLYSVVISYVSMSGEADTKLVGCLGKHSVLCDWKAPTYARKGRIDPAMEKHQEKMK